MGIIFTLQNRRIQWDELYTTLSTRLAQCQFLTNPPQYYCLSFPSFICKPRCFLTLRAEERGAILRRGEGHFAVWLADSQSVTSSLRALVAKICKGGHCSPSHRTCCDQENCIKVLCKLQNAIKHLKCSVSVAVCSHHCVFRRSWITNFSTPQIKRTLFMATVVVAGHFNLNLYPPVVCIQSEKLCLSLSGTSLPVLGSYQAQLNLSLASVCIIPTGSETSVHHWCDILCVQMSSWRLMLKTAHAFTPAALSGPASPS